MEEGRKKSGPKPKSKEELAAALPARLYARIITDPETGCELWTGSHNPVSGTPQIMVDGKAASVALVRWKLERGDVPTGWYVNRTCPTTGCVKMEHHECSPERRARSKGEARVKVSCQRLGCEETFEAWPSEIARGGAKYCCRACKSQGLAVAMEHRFQRSVDKNGPNGCHLWTAAQNGHGYGVLALPGHAAGYIQSHVYAWELHHRRKVPQGMVVRHKCPRGPVRACCNWEHLLLGAPQDNVDDTVVAGRHARGETHGTHTKPEAFPRGEKHPHSKVTDAIALQILQLCAAGELSQKEIGRLFGVSQMTVSSIWQRKTWKHIKWPIDP